MQTIEPNEDLGRWFLPFCIGGPDFAEIHIGVSVDDVVISRCGSLGRATVNIPVCMLSRVIATMQEVAPVALAATIPRNDTRYGAALELAKQFDKDRGFKR